MRGLTPWRAHLSVRLIECARFEVRLMCRKACRRVFPRPSQLKLVVVCTTAGAAHRAELRQLCEHPDRHVHQQGLLPEPREQGSAGEHQQSCEGHQSLRLATSAHAHTTHAIEKTQSVRRRRNAKKVENRGMERDGEISPV